MIRKIIFIIVLIAFAAPLLSKAKDYWDEKKSQLRTLGQAAEKAIRYK